MLGSTIVRARPAHPAPFAFFLPGARLSFRLLGAVFATALLTFAPGWAGETPATPSPLGPAPRSLEQIMAEGYLKAEQGQTAEALARFKEALQYDAGYVPAKLGLASIYSEQSKHAEAFKVFDQVVQLQPNNAIAWNGRGIASFNLEQFNEAAVSLERSIVDQPVSGFLYESLAWTYMCMGDFKQALETAKIATLMYNKKRESAAYPLLIAYFSEMETGDATSAERTLDYALKNKPPLNPWPHPVFDYLSGTIDASELLSHVQNTAEETEAHTYIGLKLRLKDEPMAASKHLDWVVERGDKRVFEYTLARVLGNGRKVATLTR